jgi:SAM-dependent methyltransferase
MMAGIAERVIVPEVLDEAHPADARLNLKDLARINRYFGGYRILKNLIGQFARTGESFSVLDVGAASGDMGRALREKYPHAAVTSLDYRGYHLAEAAEPKVVGDAFRLPFADRSFDIVFCSLFLHHFRDEDVVNLLAGFRRVARRAVCAIDLDRGPFAYHFLPATHWLFRWHWITLHDGPISVGAAFKREELLRLARQAGLLHARVRVHRPWARLSVAAAL